MPPRSCKARKPPTKPQSKGIARHTASQCPLQAPNTFPAAAARRPTGLAWQVEEELKAGVREKRREDAKHHAEELAERAVEKAKDKHAEEEEARAKHEGKRAEAADVSDLPVRPPAAVVEPATCTALQFLAEMLGYGPCEIVGQQPLPCQRPTGRGQGRQQYMPSMT